MSWVGVTIKDSINSLGQKKDSMDNQDINLHDVELEQGESANQPVSIGDVGAPGRFRHIKNRKYMRRLYLVLAALAAIFIFSSLLRLSIKSNSKRSNDIDMSGASLREKHLLIMMHDNANDDEELLDLANADSPQRQALQWIANEDSMKLEIPETRFDESYHPFLQRYSVAVLAFTWGKDILAPLGFLSGDNECNWNANFKRPDTSTLDMGIICNEDQNQVIKVVLQTLGLSSSIPKEIGNLHALKHLHLDSNKLTGKLPNRLHQMNQLRELTLTRNQISGHLPPFMATMSSLRHVELSKNLLSGHLAYAFEHSSDGGDAETDRKESPIHVLAVDNNKFSGPIDSLKVLPLLEELYINDNQFQGQIPSDFRDFFKLTIFDGSRNKFHGKIPDYFLELPSMTILDLSSNQFDGQHPHGNSSTLKYLDVHENLIEGVLPNSIGHHPELAYLDLSNNRLEGELPNSFKELKQLQFLFLGHNPNLTAGPIPDWLHRLPVLESASFKDTARIGTLPEWLGKLSQIHLFDFELNSLNGTIPASMGDMTSMEYLLLNRNELEGTVPASLGNLTQLVLLNLDHNRLTGRIADEICHHDMEVLVTDCATSDNQPEPLIECACCSKCCLNSASNCNTRDWGNRYGEEWGGYYQRYNIVEDGDVFTMVGSGTGQNNDD